MKLSIPKDAFNNPKPPRLFLCNTGKKKIGQLKAYDISLDGKWNSYGTLSFSIDRKYVDMITGETKVDPLFDKAEGLRKVYAENIGYFVIQDPDSTYSDKETKTISCFSSEYETANKYLENFRINTGEIDSAEVTYNESVHGYNYVIDKDKLYKPASGVYDPYESYYIKQKTDSDSYVWEQVQVATAEEYASYFGTGVNKDTPLHVKNYPNVRFYDETKPELSLLHIIFKTIPDWKIKTVDTSLWRKERTFSEDRVAVYDFLMNDITDTFSCVIEWDTITNEVSFYEEVEDGITTNNTVQTRFDTDVYISRENLANEINIKYSTDNIKTKLKVSGSDGLDIREINLGKSYIMNLGFYHTIDWMEQDLYLAYNKYLQAVKDYSPIYATEMQNWVAASNKHSDLMNEVPVEGNVVLIDDEFKKLYCIYSPVTDTSDAITASREALIKKLNQYHVDEDVDANKLDNILLRLRNVDDDEAIIRIYDPKIQIGNEAEYNKDIAYYARTVSPSGVSTYTKIDNSEKDFNSYNKSDLYTNDFKIQTTITRAANGLKIKSTYTLQDWLDGNLTVDNKTGTGLNNLEGFIVKYIGTMGAYFVLAKDEKQKENLQDYGVNLLKEKHKVYREIFMTQTEHLDSQEAYQCVIGDVPPFEPIPDKTRWLDTNSNPVQLYEYDIDQYFQAESYIEGMMYYVGGTIKTQANPQPTAETFNNGTYYTHWFLASYKIPQEDQLHYEDYQRYLDNYEKLQAVQEVLVEKERVATYCLDGYAVLNRSIPLNEELEKNMMSAAQEHFSGYAIRKRTFEAVPPLSENIPIAKQFPNEYIYTFTTSFDSYSNIYAVYLNGKTPYVAYANSKHIYGMKKDRIALATEFSKFFTDDQWTRLSPFIREDEFSDDNFLLTQYDSEEQKVQIMRELMESANKELNTLCQPSLEFSMTMANIFALPEFKPLIDKDQFALGNFVRIFIRDGYVKRARLLEVHINFSDLSDFSATFGNLVTTKSEIDKHAELLSQAVTAGKQVATSAGSWQKAVDKSNKLEEDIATGLRDAALEVGSANGQSIIWDSTGIWGRKLIDGTTDQYEPEQFRIINNKLVFSNDGFKTSKAVFGKYIINGEERWGPLAEYVTADMIEGKFIKGGKIEIGSGDTIFRVNENGSVEILTKGKDTYATTESVSKVEGVVEVIGQARQYRTEITYTGPTVFSDVDDECVLTCNIYSWDTKITDQILATGGKFSWTRNSNEDNTQWDADHADLNTNTITVAKTDVNQSAQFYCTVEFDDEKITL